MNQLKTKNPKINNRFSWGRECNNGNVTWRMLLKSDGTKYAFEIQMPALRVMKDKRVAAYALRQAISELKLMATYKERQ